MDYKFEDDRSNVIAAYARGDIDVDMRTVGEHQGRPRDAETPGVIIGVIDESVGGDGVIADGNINATAELKGKTVAAEPNIPARLLLQMELKKAGLSFSDLQIKDIATADTAAVFSDESIAAVATYEPFMSQAVKNSTRAGAKVLLSSKDFRGIIIDVITARKRRPCRQPKEVPELPQVHLQHHRLQQGGAGEICRTRSAPFRPDARRSDRNHRNKPCLYDARRCQGLSRQARRARQAA